jgi:hypothetical protein
VHAFSKLDPYSTGFLSVFEFENNFLPELVTLVYVENVSVEELTSKKGIKLCNLMQWLHSVWNQATICRPYPANSPSFTAMKSDGGVTVMRNHKYNDKINYDDGDDVDDDDSGNDVDNDDSGDDDDDVGDDDDDDLDDDDDGDDYDDDDDDDNRHL